MRMLKKAAIATVTAASLTVMGAGAATAEDVKKKKPSVEANLTQTQTCTYKALIPINVALLNMDTGVGSFKCAQAGSIG